MANTKNSNDAEKGLGRMLTLSNEEIESLFTVDLAHKSLERAYCSSKKHSSHDEKFAAHNPVDFMRDAKKSGPTNPLHRHFGRQHQSW